VLDSRWNEGPDLGKRRERADFVSPQLGTWMDAEDGIALLPSPGSCKDESMNDGL
jgi:hypothetical protein